MKHYFVAQIKIHNQEEYEKYLEKVDEVFSGFKGKYLAVDESPILLEGKWNYSKSVIIEFPGKKDFEEWYYSEAYQGILSHLLEGSQCDTILLEGLE